MSKKQVSAQVMSELIYTHIYQAAKIASYSIRNKQVTMSELKNWIKALDIEGHNENSYADPTTLVKDTHAYYTEKEQHNKAKTIENVFFDQNRQKVVRK